MGECFVMANKDDLLLDYLKAYLAEGEVRVGDCYPVICRLEEINNADSSQFEDKNVGVMINQVILEAMQVTIKEIYDITNAMEHDSLDYVNDIKLALARIEGPDGFIWET